VEAFRRAEFKDRAADRVRKQGIRERDKERLLLCQWKDIADNNNNTTNKD